MLPGAEGRDSGVHAVKRNSHAASKMVSRSATSTGSFAFVITRVAITFTALKIISQRSERRRENKLTKSANFFWSVFQPFHQYLFSSPAPGRTGRETRRLLFGLAIVVDALPVDEEFDCGFDEGTLPRLTITGQSSLSPVIHSYSKLTGDVV